MTTPFDFTRDQMALGRELLADRHGKRCVSVSLALAQRLGVHDPEALDALALGATIHDFGKAWVPAWITLKAGKLEPDEFEAMKLHPVAGAEFLAAIGVNGYVRNIVKYHHERWNGLGYPDGLAGTAIPNLPRIVAVVDTYDALRSLRNYPRYDAKGNFLKGNGEFSHDEAMRIVEGGAGLYFDPRVAKAFLKMKDREFR